MRTRVSHVHAKEQLHAEQEQNIILSMSIIQSHGMLTECWLDKQSRHVNIWLT